MREPDINKGFLGTLAPLMLIAQIRRSSARSRKTVSAVVLDALELKFGRVRLGKEDRDWIAEQQKKNMERRESNRRERNRENQ